MVACMWVLTSGQEMLESFMQQTLGWVNLRGMAALASSKTPSKEQIRAWVLVSNGLVEARIALPQPTCHVRPAMSIGEITPCMSMF